MYNTFRRHIRFLYSFDTHVLPTLMLICFVINNGLCIILFSETLEQTESPTVKFADDDDEAADSESSAPSGKLIKINIDSFICSCFFFLLLNYIL